MPLTCLLQFLSSDHKIIFILPVSDLVVSRNIHPTKSFPGALNCMGENLSANDCTCISEKLRREEENAKQKIAIKIAANKVSVTFFVFIFFDTLTIKDIHCLFKYTPKYYFLKYGTLLRRKRIDFFSIFSDVGVRFREFDHFPTMQK